MDIYERAIKAFGEKAQLTMVMEEAAELIQACSKEIRGKGSNINEEIADIEIMIEQLKHCSGYNQELVDQWHNMKVKDLDELISEHIIDDAINTTVGSAKIVLNRNEFTAHMPDGRVVDINKFINDRKVHPKLKHKRIASDGVIDIAYDHIVASLHCGSCEAGIVSREQTECSECNTKIDWSSYD
jgi:NTP pyrophosphatase (non-canonical NTP hydrolase)